MQISPTNNANNTGAASSASPEQPAANFEPASNIKIRPPAPFKTLARHNLKQKPVRTAGLITVVAVLTLVFFVGTTLSSNLNGGLASLQQRMGADLVIVPLESQKQTEEVLLAGGPQTFYFHSDVESTIRQVKGVKEVTIQTYVASLSAGCCQAKIQIIGFDPNTDFVIQPWIKSQFKGILEDGEMITGANVHPSSNGKVRLFKNWFPVASQLAPTGTSFDNTVFVNRNTVERMRHLSAKIGRRTIEKDQVKTAVSSVFVNVQDDVKADTVAQRISKALEGKEAAVVSPSNLTTKVKTSMSAITTYVVVFTSLFWLTGLLVLCVVFMTVANERKKELSSLRIMGATRPMVTAVMIKEALWVGFLGGLIGLLLGTLLVFPFSTLIQTLLDLPYLPGSIFEDIVVAGVSLVMALFLCVLASGIATVRILGGETYLTLRQGD